MRSPAIAAGDVTRALREATEAAASLIGVARASVWRFDDKRSRIECLDLYEATKKEHSSGIVLYAADAPTYFAAMAGERVIAAHDARQDPRTKEFAIGYLLPLGITSMLDAPGLLHGRVAGVVCLEHVGPARKWEPAEELVAGSLADFIGMALGAAAHAEQARELASLRTQELRGAQAMVRRLFETSPVALVVTKLSDQTVIVVNERASQMFGVPLEAAPGHKAPDFWVHPEDRQRLIDGLRAHGRFDNLEAELKTADGSKFWGLVSAATVDYEGTPAVVVGAHDITAQKGVQDTLRKLLEAAPIPLVVTGLDDAVVRFSNTRAADMFRTTMDAFVGKRAPDFYVNPSDRKTFIDALKNEGRVDGFAARLRTVDGNTFWSLLSARTLDLDGARAFMVGFADLTEQKEIETKLRDLAELDGLTGAFNRRHFFDIAGSALARTIARGKPACLAMIDADHFKNVNDKYGHAVGDEALRLMTNVARGASRGSDILARYGGEELVLLLNEADAESAKAVAERIRAGLASSPLTVPNAEPFTISVSIGVVQHREGESIEELVRRADAAMYEAKRAGRNRVVVAD